MDWLNRLPFRLGTTSYILPDEILPNVRYLADKVGDVELVLFEVDQKQNNLPSTEVVTELAALAGEHDLTYTVHLPLDLEISSAGFKTQESILKAERTIAATRGLTPQAYIVHLDGREVRNKYGSEEFLNWQERAAQLLEQLALSAGGENLLAVENLENYPPGFWEQALENLPTGRCVDVGHLWLEGYDPLPYLEQAKLMTSVVHLHGKEQRDHASLAQVEAGKLDAVLQFLIRAEFHGVVTLEVFNQVDFLSSMRAVENSLGRIGYN